MAAGDYFDDLLNVSQQHVLERLGLNRNRTFTIDGTHYVILGKDADLAYAGVGPSFDEAFASAVRHHELASEASRRTKL